MNPSGKQTFYSPWPWIETYRGLLQSGLSGLLCYFCFPPACCGWLVIFAVVPFLLAVFSEGTAARLSLGGQLRRGAALGGSFALVLYSLLGFWSSEISPFAWILWTLLTAGFYAVWGALAVTIVRRWQGPTEHRRKKLYPILCHLELAAAWWAWEWIRSLITPGSDIGTCLAYSGKIIQIADLTGQLGVSAFVIFVSCQVAFFVHCLGNKSARQGLVSSTMITAGIVLTAGGYAHWRNLKIRRVPSVLTLKCITIQPHLPNPTGATEVLNWMLTLKRHTEEALAICPNPDLVVWPESALKLSLGSPFANNILPKNLPATCLFYSGFEEVRNGSSYNSLGVFDAKFKLLASHQKTHLMPFTEYIPWGLTSISDLVVPKSKQNYFTPGHQHAALRSSIAADYSVIPLICYEDCGSTSARLRQEHGSLQLIIDIANGAAFRQDQGAVQHFTNATFRAIELGRPLLRCANGGYSAHLNQGDFPELRFLKSKPNFQIASVQLKAVPPTLFALWGHHLPLVAFIFTGICFGFRLRSPVEKRLQEP